MNIYFHWFFLLTNYCNHCPFPETQTYYCSFKQNGRRSQVCTLDTRLSYLYLFVISEYIRYHSCIYRKHNQDWNSISVYLDFCLFIYQTNLGAYLPLTFTVLWKSVPLWILRSFTSDSVNCYEVATNTQKDAYPCFWGKVLPSLQLPSAVLLNRFDPPSSFKY